MDLKIKMFKNKVSILLFPLKILKIDWPEAKEDLKVVKKEINLFLTPHSI